MLSTWRETTLYNERERAALAWTETLTRLPERARLMKSMKPCTAVFSEEEQVALTLLVGIINSFNRIGVGFHVPPVSQQPAQGGVMPGTSAPDPAAVFDPLRPKLARIAYRMLGSVADAEDVVQDAFLRWMAT